jgi:hypothetical protein
MNIQASEALKSALPMSRTLTAASEPRGRIKSENVLAHVRYATTALAIGVAAERPLSRRSRSKCRIYLAQTEASPGKCQSKRRGSVPGSRSCVRVSRMAPPEPFAVPEQKVQPGHMSAGLRRCPA